MEPDIISKNELIRITDKKSGYVLSISDNWGPSFRIPSPTDDNGRIAITSRSLIEYGFELPFSFNPKKQYSEIGPGLGGYIPLLARFYEQSPKSPKPIAIDLVNYEILLEMMNFAVDEGFTTSEYAEEKTTKLIERAEIITNPKKVRLINKPLGQALEDHPELLGTVDDVVDNFGGILYCDIVEKISNGEMSRLEDSLLKPRETRIY
jgi:hypothetical protein